MMIYLWFLVCTSSGSELGGLCKSDDILVIFLGSCAYFLMKLLKSLEVCVQDEFKLRWR